MLERDNGTLRSGIRLTKRRRQALSEDKDGSRKHHQRRHDSEKRPDVSASQRPAGVRHGEKRGRPADDDEQVRRLVSDDACAVDCVVVSDDDAVEASRLGA